MKCLLCCTLVPAEYEIRIKDISNAANRFINNFLNYFERKNETEILSYIGVNVTQKVRTELQELSPNYYFKTKLKIGGVLRYWGAIIRKIQTVDCVITYNVEYTWLIAPFVARLFKKKSLLILADYSPSNSFNEISRKILARIQKLCLRRYDYVIGLSEKTRKYTVHKQKFLCIEGGITADFYNYYNNYKKLDMNRLCFMYAGILESVTGVDRLLEAFSNVNHPNIRLFISGKGSLESLVEQATDGDERIVYLGCPSYEEYMANLERADVLVNPRNMELAENANNFPSKIMEYLATGKRIVSTKFPGWEKFSPCITFCGSDAKDIETAIRQMIKADSWSVESYKRNRLVAQEYLWNEQIQKVNRLISG
ncbi:MAG: glycosyltransferase family 4 protein [Lachnospiraceae bacterium]|nr:glycosyltransferase family 4 protein [Lachnospiraceae bacterium]